MNIKVDRDDLYGIRWGIKKGSEDSINHALETLAELLGEKKPIIIGPDKEEVVEVVPDPIRKDGIKVALVIGHNAKNKGAYVKKPMGEFEFDFNNQIADLIVNEPPTGVICKRFNRIYTGSYSREIDNVYRQVNDWNPTFIVELHFNGYNGVADYTCMLAAKSSTTSQKCAAIMQEVFVDHLGFPDKGIFKKGSGERGGRSLYAGKASCVLTEPFFGDNQASANKIAELGHEGMAKIYREAIQQVVDFLA